MGKGRLEAFSDGVIAILITIMVLELRPPEGAVLADLRPLIPTFLSYVLSFIYIGIYWNNHHHMLHVTKSVTGAILWANLFLLFCLSLVPFTTAWMGENYQSAQPVAAYGGLLLMTALAYSVLQILIVKHEGRDSTLARATRRDIKGYGSLVCYTVAIPLAFVLPAIAQAIYVFVAVMWFVPDRRIERVVKAEEG